MKKYEIIYYYKTEKELLKLAKNERRKIVEKIGHLKTNPRPHNSIKLVNNLNYHRLRMGDYRVVYKIDDDKKEIYIITVKHRSDVYRNM